MFFPKRLASDFLLFDSLCGKYSFSEKIVSGTASSIFSFLFLLFFHISESEILMIFLYFLINFGQQLLPEILMKFLVSCWI